MTDLDAKANLHRYLREAREEPNADMWATADESRADIIGRWRRVWAHADATIETLPIDAPGSVRW